MDKLVGDICSLLQETVMSKKQKTAVVDPVKWRIAFLSELKIAGGSQPVLAKNYLCSDQSLPKMKYYG